MRDNNQGYSEIISAFERGGLYFGVIRVVLTDGARTVEFGVTMSGFFALKRILNARPFDTLPAVPYRFFLNGSFIGDTNPGQETFDFGIRIEQGMTAKKFMFKGPKALLANLLWFSELKCIEETSGLKVFDPSNQLP